MAQEPDALGLETGLAGESRTADHENYAPAPHDPSWWPASPRLPRRWPFSQRYTGTFSADGKTLSGAWEICHDGATWEHDCELTPSIGLVVVELFEQVGADVAGADRDRSDPVPRVVECEAAGEREDGALRRAVGTGEFALCHGLDQDGRPLD